MKTADAEKYIPAIERAHHFIESNLQRNFSLKELADAAHLSYHRFAHVFSENTNQPLWNYVKQYRLKYAAGLLRHSAYSISDIAELTGYGGVQSLTKAFSDQFSQSPKRFSNSLVIPNNHILRFIPNDATAIATMETACYITEPETEYWYCRATEETVQEKMVNLFENAAINGADMGSLRVAASSPDVYMLTAPNKIRIDVGYWVKPNELSPLITAGLYKKTISAGRFLHKASKLPPPMAGLFVFELIESASRYSLSSIRNHHSMVRINIATGVPTTEFYIPVL